MLGNGIFIEFGHNDDPPTYLLTNRPGSRDAIASKNANFEN